MNVCEFLNCRSFVLKFSRVVHLLSELCLLILDFFQSCIQSLFNFKILSLCIITYFLHLSYDDDLILNYPILKLQCCPKIFHLVSHYSASFTVWLLFFTRLALISLSYIFQRLGYLFMCHLFILCFECVAFFFIIKDLQWCDCFWVLWMNRI